MVSCRIGPSYSVRAICCPGPAGSGSARAIPQLDPPPRGRRDLVNLLKHLRRPPPQGDEVHAHAVEFIQVGMGGQLRVEHQFLGQMPGPLLPECDEAQDLVVLLIFPQIAVGIAEHAGLRICRQKCQDPLLPPTPLGNIVFFDQGVVAVVGNGVEVQIEGGPPFEPSRLTASNQPRIKRVAAWIDPATVFGEERSLGNHVEPGEQGQPFVEPYS